MFSIAEGSAKAEGELTQTDIQSPGRIVRESIQLLSLKIEQAITSLILFGSEKIGLPPVFQL